MESTFHEKNYWKLDRRRHHHRMGCCLRIKPTTFGVLDKIVLRCSEKPNPKCFCETT